MLPYWKGYLAVDEQNRYERITSCFLVNSVFIFYLSLPEHYFCINVYPFVSVVCVIYFHDCHSCSCALSSLSFLHITERSKDTSALMLPRTYASIHFRFVQDNPSTKLTSVLHKKPSKMSAASKTRRGKRRRKFDISGDNKIFLSFDEYLETDI